MQRALRKIGFNIEDPEFRLLVLYDLCGKVVLDVLY